MSKCTMIALYCEFSQTVHTGRTASKQMFPDSVHAGRTVLRGRTACARERDTLKVSAVGGQFGAIVCLKR